MVLPRYAWDRLYQQRIRLEEKLGGTSHIGEKRLAESDQGEAFHA